MANAEPQSNGNRVYKPNRVLKIFIWVVASSVLIGATVWSVTNTVEFYLGYNPISMVSMQYDDISVCYVEKTRILEDTVPSFAYLSASLNSTTFIKLLQAEHTRLQIITDNFAKKCGTADCWSANYHKLLAQLNSPLLRNGQLQFVWLMARLFNEVENNFYPTEVTLEPLGTLINDYKNLWQTINNQYPVVHFRNLVDSIICYKMGLSEFSFSIRHDHVHNRTKWNGFVVNNPCSMDNIWWSGIDLSAKETEFICVRTDGQHWLNFSRDTRKHDHLVSPTHNKYFLNLNGTTVVVLKPKSFVLYNVEEMLAMDNVQFLSALGGCLSLWINASFVGVLHVAVFIIRKFIVVLRGSCRHERSQIHSVSTLVESVSNVDMTNVRGDQNRRDSRIETTESMIAVNERKRKNSASRLTKRNRSHLSK